MERIGLTHYKLLKAQSTLTDAELEKVKNFEAITEPTEEQIKYRQEYSQKLWSEPEYIKPKFEPEAVLQALQSTFMQLRGYEFKNDIEALTSLKTLVYYFTEDKRFFKSPNLRSQLSTPNFAKGLLIVGGYGNGKSSMFEVLRTIFCTFKDYAFKSYNANTVIEMYETANGYHEKEEFWNHVLKGRCHFDDVKTERPASNYGKTNLFKDILEKRYDSRLKTYITCNYHEQYPNDLSKAINEFGEKYGGRVHDRLFEMFNILEFNGKSYRL